MFSSNYFGYWFIIRLLGIFSFDYKRERDIFNKNNGINTGVYRTVWCTFNYLPVLKRSKEECDLTCEYTSQVQALYTSPVLTKVSLLSFCGVHLSLAVMEAEAIPERSGNINGKEQLHRMAWRALFWVEYNTPDISSALQLTSDNYMNS